MPRLPLALASVVALGAAVLTAAPASAQTLEECATSLRDATTGTYATCFTQGPPPLGNRNVSIYRTATIEVAAGAVDATLACDGHALPVQRVSGPVPFQFGGYGTGNCSLQLVAVVDHTTAVATSTYSYVIDLQ